MMKSVALNLLHVILQATHCDISSVVPKVGGNVASCVCTLNMLISFLMLIEIGAVVFETSSKTGHNVGKLLSKEEPINPKKSYIPNKSLNSPSL